MVAIIYNSHHGATKKIAQMISSHLKGAKLVALSDVNEQELGEIKTIICGIPVYNDQLDEEMVTFIKEHQDLLIAKHYSIYVSAIFASEFMHYLTEAFDYTILKDVKTLAGLGGSLDFSKLSAAEKIKVALMRKRRPLANVSEGPIYENFNKEEIKNFASKVKRIDEAA
jgi:menaquinone-dependent protoporphyrinogen IX oxidase